MASAGAIWVKPGWYPQCIWLTATIKSGHRRISTKRCTIVQPTERGDFKDQEQNGQGALRGIAAECRCEFDLEVDKEKARTFAQGYFVLVVVVMDDFFFSAAVLILSLDDCRSI